MPAEWFLTAELTAPAPPPLVQQAEKCLAIVTREVGHRSQFAFAPQQAKAVQSLLDKDA